MGPVHHIPNYRDLPPVPQSQLPLYFAPFFALLGVLGLALIGYELPAVLLLFSREEGSALALLRTYWTGRFIGSALALLSPLLFLGLTFLLYWLTARKLDPELRRQNRLAPLLLLPVLLPAIGILMWSALAPSGTCAFCDRVGADIQQIEAGEPQCMTVFIHEASAPDPLFRDNPEGWQVKQRTVFGPDTGAKGMVLRFPDAVESALDPEGFAADSWDSVQWYKVYYTTEFHLVERIIPISYET